MCMHTDIHLCIKMHSTEYALLYDCVHAHVSVCGHECKCRYLWTSVDIKFLGPRFIGVSELHYMRPKSKMGVLYKLNVFCCG